MDSKEEGLSKKKRKRDESEKRILGEESEVIDINSTYFEKNISKNLSNESSPNASKPSKVQKGKFIPFEPKNKLYKKRHYHFVTPFKYEFDQEKYKKLRKEKEMNFEKIDIEEIKREMESFLRIKEKISFFIKCISKEKKYVKMLQEIFTKMFNSYISSHDDAYFCYFIGGNLKHELGKTLETWKNNLEDFDSEVSGLTISIYENFEFLFLDKEDLLGSNNDFANGFNMKHNFDDDYLKRIRKKVKDIKNYREKNS